MHNSVAFNPEDIIRFDVKTVFETDAQLGECPRWDEQSQCLYWVDIEGGRLHCFNPATGHNITRQFDEAIACMALHEQQGFVIAMASGIYRLATFDSEPTLICHPEQGVAGCRYNDGRCDPSGRFWVASMYLPKDAAKASIFSIAGQGQVQQPIQDLYIGNGLAFSPCGQSLYFADSARHAIFKAALNLDTGAVAEPILFHRFPVGFGRPDGAAVDSEGNLWTALFDGGRIAKLSPSGQLLAEFPVPARCPTMVAFGGEDLKTLYITSAAARNEDERAQYPHAGSLFSARLDVPGIREPRFLGE